MKIAFKHYLLTNSSETKKAWSGQWDRKYINIESERERKRGRERVGAILQRRYITFLMSGKVRINIRLPVHVKPFNFHIKCQEVPPPSIFSPFIWFILCVQKIFCIVSYYIKWVKTAWTYSIQDRCRPSLYLKFSITC